MNDIGLSTEFLNALGFLDAYIMSRRSIKGKRCHILIGSVVARNAHLYGKRGPPVNECHVFA